jgi:hypothetical protein
MAVVFNLSTSETIRECHVRCLSPLRRYKGAVPMLSVC